MAGVLILLQRISPRTWLIIGLLAAFVAVGGYCSVRATMKERGRGEAATAKANLKAERRNSAANETAADERLADARSTANLKEELTDAVQSLPDDVPSDRRVALACARLRHAGTDTAALPACQRLAGRAQAGPQP